MLRPNGIGRKHSIRQAFHGVKLRNESTDKICMVITSLQIVPVLLNVYMTWQAPSGFELVRFLNIPETLSCPLVILPGALST
jgi:hypothetical protein